MNQQLLSLCRCQKLCQLLLSISQVSLISQHTILHLSVEQSPCKYKSFVAKVHLGCSIAISFPTLNAASFPWIKPAMWPAAGADKVQHHAKQRERRVTTNSCFVLSCSGCYSVVAWAWGAWSRAQLLHSVFYWSPAWLQSRSWSLGSLTRSQTGPICHLST